MGLLRVVRSIFRSRALTPFRNRVAVEVVGSR